MTLILIKWVNKATMKNKMKLVETNIDVQKASQLSGLRGAVGRNKINWQQESDKRVIFHDAIRRVLSLKHRPKGFTFSIL